VDKKAIRNVFYYKRYYLDFFESLRPEVKAKFNWTLGLIETLDRVPSKFFCYMENSDGIYEIRVEAGSDIFRVFSFFDKGQLIILANGFQKKSRKTPKKEIELAEKLKKQYFNEKESK
jgi:phage-related protein